jgi:hypothetical protein
MENPLKYFADLRDPRVERNREHLLQEILLIAIAAVLSGAESWNDIAQYGEEKRAWLQTFLTLPSGIPSHVSGVNMSFRSCCLIRECYRILSIRMLPNRVLCLEHSVIALAEPEGSAVSEANRANWRFSQCNLVQLIIRR